MKICTTCKIEKPTESFYTDKRTSDGLYSSCAQCHQKTKKKAHNLYTSEMRARVRLSPNYNDVGYLMYYGIQSRILSGRKCYAHVKCLLSLQELRDFIKSDWANYEKLHKVWKENGFDRKHIPSLDRIDSAKHYELGNIQIITLSANVAKSNNPYKRGPRSLEQRQKISATMTGRKISEEHRESWRRGAKARWDRYHALQNKQNTP